MSTPKLYDKLFINELPLQEKSFINKSGNSVLNLINQPSEEDNIIVCNNKSVGKAYYQMSGQPMDKPGNKHMVNRSQYKLTSKYSKKTNNQVITKNRRISMNKQLKPKSLSSKKNIKYPNSIQKRNTSEKENSKISYSMKKLEIKKSQNI